MLNQKKWFVLLAALFLGLAVEVIAPESCLKIANAEATTVEETEETLELLCTEDIWREVYKEVLYGTELLDRTVAALAMAEVEARDVELMTSATDRIVSYHGRRFAITEDEYQVLLQIVEAETPCEDVIGKLMVANVVLNRLETGVWGNTISDVVFARGQFEPVSNGSIFWVTPSEETLEAVERAMGGEDVSQGAMYFMARILASSGGVRWFDKNLQFLYEYGGHEFFVEKD